MKIYFHGTTDDVTGSAYHVKTKHASVVVDCGLCQGGKEARAQNRQRAKLEGGRLHTVVLSHAHLDHVGRLPLRTKAGYGGLTGGDFFAARGIAFCEGGVSMAANRIVGICP